MTTRPLAAALGAALLLGGCQMTGNPTTDRAAAGALGGALAGQILGRDTGSTLAGAAVGGLLGAATAPRQPVAAPATRGAHPCADIYERYSHPEVASDYCAIRMGR